MPRYVRVADIPAILLELQTIGKSAQPSYQLDKWQRKWCLLTHGPLQGAAVLSYRWRTRGTQECIRDYQSWLEDCREQGFDALHLWGSSAPAVDYWSLVDGHDLQIEVAVWLLWLHANQEAEYAWLDQMCVPQDVDVEEKIRNIRDSPAIYLAGKVYVMLAPVVDESGKIMNKEAANAIVDQYTDEMNAFDLSSRVWLQTSSPGFGAAWFLRKSAVKSLLVNHSYMRRVWTIQEAVSSSDLQIWPLNGRGNIKSYQNLHVVDWPEFNAWNAHPLLEPLNYAFGDPIVNSYLDGEYAGVLGVLRRRSPGAIGHLALMSKDLMWATQDRNGLVADIQTADSPAKKAAVVLNSHQVINARSSVQEDRVLALVPLVDYPGWQAAAEGVHSSRLVQVSVAWAYDIMERGQDWRWSIRIYNSPSCQARALDLMQPRRNFKDRTAVHGTTPGWRLQIPIKGGTFLLTAPPPSADPRVASATASTDSNNNNDSSSSSVEAAPPSADAGNRITATAATAAAPAEPTSLELRVLCSVLMPHPGKATNWNNPIGDWAPLRSTLRAHPGDDGFRLSVQWALEPWRDPALGLDLERSAAVVAAGEGLTHPALILLALTAGEEEPATAQVMAVLDIRTGGALLLLDEVLVQLAACAIGELTAPLTVVSAGLPPAAPA